MIKIKRETEEALIAAGKKIDPAFVGEIKRQNYLNDKVTEWRNVGYSDEVIELKLKDIEGIGIKE